jgi:hypothetical protein
MQGCAQLGKIFSVSPHSVCGAAAYATFGHTNSGLSGGVLGFGASAVPCLLHLARPFCAQPWRCGVLPEAFPRRLLCR